VHPNDRVHGDRSGRARVRASGAVQVHPADHMGGIVSAGAPPPEVSAHSRVRSVRLLCGRLRSPPMIAGWRTSSLTRGLRSAGHTAATSERRTSWRHRRPAPTAARSHRPRRACRKTRAGPVDPDTSKARASGSTDRPSYKIEKTGESTVFSAPFRQGIIIVVDREK